MEKEFGLLYKAGIQNLLFCALDGWMIGYLYMNDLSARQFHDDDYVKDTEPDCVVNKKVTGPYGLGLILQKGFPCLGISVSRAPFNHVSPYGRAGMANAKFYLQLQRDTILSVFWMIRRYPLDKANVLNRYLWSARFPL